MKLAIVKNIKSESMKSNKPIGLHQILDQSLLAYCLHYLKACEFDAIYIEDDDEGLIKKAFANEDVYSPNELTNLIKADDDITYVNGNDAFILNQHLDLYYHPSKTKYASDAFTIKSRHDLAKANQLVKEFVNNYHLDNGITLVDPNNTYIGCLVEIGMDTIIYPNVSLLNNTKIGTDCEILANSYLRNAILHNNIIIDASKIVESEIDDGTTIGPMSHLRNNCFVGQNVRIGNFVEFKNTNFANGSKCAHLTYVGDSDVGQDVNFGCGVVTVNYDGKYKYRTTIKNGAFIGSNCNLIAPVTIGENTVLAAGSTITDSVDDGDMGIARPRQSIIKGFGTKYKDKNKQRKD